MFLIIWSFDQDTSHWEHIFPLMGALCVPHCITFIRFLLRIFLSKMGQQLKRLVAGVPERACTHTCARTHMHTRTQAQHWGWSWVRGPCANVWYGKTPHLPSDPLQWFMTHWNRGLGRGPHFLFPLRAVYVFICTTHCRNERKFFFGFQKNFFVTISCLSCPLDASLLHPVFSAFIPALFPAQRPNS